MTQPAKYQVAFPTLFVAVDWAQRHCIVPGGFRRGQPWRYYPWQAWCTLNHYRVKPEALWVPEDPLLAAAFHYRRSIVIAPQKTGKGPWSATGCAIEGAGPALFGGWAGPDDGYACEDWGCGCGWEYAYAPGEAMGIRWPTPLIQITAFSDDQADNIYGHLKRMVNEGPLGDLMRAGEDVIRIGIDGEIATVTSSAQSRLGNPITYAAQDETGIYTKANKMKTVADTQRRGLAGMGGRSQETSNAYDPTQHSTCQDGFEGTVEDVFKFYEKPPEHLSFKNKVDRRKLFLIVYSESKHVNIDGIEAETAELVEKGEEAQAERFFGNRMKAGTGLWLREITKWTDRAKPRDVPHGTPIVLGFDGSDTDDWTGIRAQTRDGYQFTPKYGPVGIPTIWDPADHGGQVPRPDVHEAVKWLMKHYRVARMYVDPPDWKSECDTWAGLYGEDVVIRWYTQRPVQMHEAAQRLLLDLTKTDTAFAHDGCPSTKDHIEATCRDLIQMGKVVRYVLCKPEDKRKIDLTICSILANEAAGDVTAAGEWLAAKKTLTRVTGRVRGY